MSDFGQIRAQWNSRLPDNTEGLISPADVREPIDALLAGLIALALEVEAIKQQIDDDD